ncbi:helix-turn-helix domain-containing protein [Patescibacteria group bacterium]|nr:helix-turn-helix domain-containing protein [Patescibacteria group bacterium]
MAESVKSKFDKRIIFPSGEQSRFLLTAKEKSKLSWLEFAKKIGIHKRTLNDWKREKYHASLNIIKKISRQTNTKILKNIEVRDPFWYVNKGAKVGGLTVYKKYGRIGGDPEYRKKKWYEWWEKEGRFKKHPIINVCRLIKKPRISKDLAEFVGIMIGDGGVTKSQVSIYLNPITDNAYIVFVTKLIKRLFGIMPSFYKNNETEARIVVSRTRLVSFCKSIGLKIGNKLKQNLDIPDWVKDKKCFKNACMRGLMDTDGCFFNECHKINKKIYCYPRLAFSSNSKQLRSSVVELLKELNFSPKVRCKRNVQLENREDIIRYFNLIGTSNPKHRRKFEIAFGGVG